MIRRFLVWLAAKRPKAPSTAEELAEAKQRAEEIRARVDFLEQYREVLQRRDGGRPT